MNNNNTDKIPIWEKANLTIKEAAEYSNIGINRIEEFKDAGLQFCIVCREKKTCKTQGI